MLYNTIFISRKFNFDGMLWMRLTNNTGSPFNAISGYSFDHLFNVAYSSGSPKLTSAVVERSGGTVTNVKGTGNSILGFSVANGESCVIRFSWVDGLFVLYGSDTTNHYRNIVTSAGCKIYGNYDIPTWFMYNLFKDCVNYVQDPNDIFDTSQLRPNNIGNYVFQRTFSGCTRLTNAVMPDATNWTPGSIGAPFIIDTFTGSFPSLASTLTLKGVLWVTTVFNTNSMGIDNNRITNIKVDPGLVGLYQASPNWSNISDSKFITW